MSLRIAVVSEQSDFITALRRVGETFEAEVVDATSSAGIEFTTASGIISNRPRSIMLGAELGLERLVSLTEEIEAIHPDVVVTWITEGDADMWRAATQAGARDLVSPASSDDALQAHVDRILSIGDRRYQRVDLDLEDGLPAKGRIVTVVSPKGGSGKTMLSTNLAVGLTEWTPRDVVLVDLDLQFGDVSSSLGVQADYTVGDLIRTMGDATTMKAFLTPHPTGVFTLAAPANPVEAEEIDTGQIAKLLDMLAAEFAWVIVDTGAGIEESTLTAVEQSTDVIFITTIDVAAIQAMRKLIVVLDKLHLDTHNRWFVLNRSTSRVGLTKAEIQEVTGLAIDVEIPEHKAVSTSMNQGSPVVADGRRSRIGRALAETAELLAGDGSRRRGLFR